MTPAPPSVGAAAAAAPGRSRPIAIATVVGAGVIAACQMGKLPGSLPLLRAEFGLTLTDGAWLLSVFSLLGVSIAMLLGALGDRVGHRRMLVAGLLVLAAGSALGASAANYAALLASRVLEGCGFILVVAVAPPLFLRDTALRHRGLAYGCWGGYWPAGMAIMTLLTPVLLQALDWRGLWLLNTALCILAALAVLALTRSDPARGARASGNTLVGNVLRTASSRGPWLLALSFAAFGSIHVSLVSLLPTYYTEHDGLSLELAATLTALVAALNIAGNLTGGLALHAGVARWRLLACTFAAVMALSLICFAPGLPFSLRVSAALLLSTCAGIIPACLLAGAAVLAPAPHLIGATTGLVMQGSQLGQFAGPVAVAASVASAGSWAAAPVTHVIAGCAGVALALALRRVEAAPRPRDSGATPR